MVNFTKSLEDISLTISEGWFCDTSSIVGLIPSSCVSSRRLSTIPLDLSWYVDLFASFTSGFEHACCNFLP